jgi:hypothetical protein
VLRAIIAIIVFIAVMHAPNDHALRRGDSALLALPHRSAGRCAHGGATGPAYARRCAARACRSPQIGWQSSICGQMPRQPPTSPSSFTIAPHASHICRAQTFRRWSSIHRQSVMLGRGSLTRTCGPATIPHRVRPLSLAARYKRSAGVNDGRR